MDMRRASIFLITVVAATLFATGSFAADIMGVDIHGFISQGYLTTTDNYFQTDTSDGKFAFNEVGINFGKALTENLRFGIQLFARDFGDISNNEIQVDWGFADYRFNQFFGLRFGQIKTPHGLYNEARDIDMLRNPIFLPDSVYQELTHDVFVHDIYLAVQGISSRDLYLSLQGVGIYGYVDLNTIGGISYQAVYGTQSIEPNVNIGQRQIEIFTDLIPSDVIPSDSLESDSVDVKYKYAGNLVWDTPFDGLRLGFSLDNVQLTANSRFTRDIEFQPSGGGDPIPFVSAGELATAEYEKLENWVYSVEYTWDNLILSAEYIRTNKDYKINVSQLNVSRESEPLGWYIGGAYRFISWFELGGYYSQTRNDKPALDSFLPAPDFFSEFDDLCLTTRFDINEYWTIKLEAHRLRGVYSLPITDNAFEFEYIDVEEDWRLYVAKMTVAF